MMKTLVRMHMACLMFHASFIPSIFVFLLSHAYQEQHILAGILADYDRRILPTRDGSAVKVKVRVLVIDLAEAKSIHSVRHFSCYQNLSTGFSERHQAVHKGQRKTRLSYAIHGEKSDYLINLTLIVVVLMASRLPAETFGFTIAVDT
eukprot:Seg1061.3 transcript_id=Seg1061.3/GoldUCD/mRNA.D3Y31 product="hypothetical protein" protein_id=Seg1061.3/GoldUCD/D3Y31